jgi:very-short-patch-repair endonuclease
VSNSDPLRDKLLEEIYIDEDNLLVDKNSRDWLIREYYGNCRSLQNIAEELETTKTRLRTKMIKLSIPIKDKSMALKDALKRGTAKHPTKGTIRSEDVKRKISEGNYKAWNNSSEEMLKHRSEMSKKQWEKMPEFKKEDTLKKARNGIRVAAKEGSKLEKFIYSELTDLGYEVQYHSRNVIPNTNLEVDIVIRDLSVAIEIDGKSHYLPIWGEDNLKKNIRADSEKNGLLINNGFVVIRLRQMANCLSMITKEKAINLLIDRIEEIEKKFPNENNRLIEIIVE